MYSYFQEVCRKEASTHQALDAESGESPVVLVALDVLGPERSVAVRMRYTILLRV